MTDISTLWDGDGDGEPAADAMASFSVVDNDVKWAEKHWMNVPGPFYTGQTDTCWTGRLQAPHHVLYGGEYYNEFVYRQPRSREQVEALVAAADQDPFGGYACDGDSRWTPEAVRSWWRERGRVREHLEALLAEWTAEGADKYEVEAAAGAREALAYLAGDLETDLRAYLYRLEHGRYPDAGVQLPVL